MSGSCEVWTFVQLFALFGAGWIYQLVDELCDLLGVERRTLFRYLARLEASGWMIVERKDGKVRRRLKVSHHYAKLPADALKLRAGALRTALARVIHQKLDQYPRRVIAAFLGLSYRAVQRHDRDLVAAGAVRFYRRFRDGREVAPRVTLPRLWITCGQPGETFKQAQLWMSAVLQKLVRRGDSSVQPEVEPRGSPDPEGRGTAPGGALERP